MSKEYAPLPFSYLTGGVAPENKSTGFKRSESNSSNPEAADGVPYSIYSGRTLDQQDQRKRTKVTSLDVADPYLLSTGALNGTDTTAADPTALFSRLGGSGEPRNSFAEDPRYRDSIPSESDGGNVFFRSPDAKETHKSQTQPTTTGDSSAGYVNLAHDREDEFGKQTDVGPTKKLPRFVLSDKGVYQYYTGSENQPNDRRTGDDVPSNDVDKAENPIWDKYYATGGLHPGDYGEKKVTDGLSAGVRPTTNVGDFNTSVRATPSEKNHSSASCCCCCTSKKSAVLCAVFITAIICLAVGFVCGWFIYQEYGSRLVGNGTSGLSSIATTLPSATTTTTTPSPTTTTLTSFNNVTASTNQNMSITTVT